MCAKLWLRAKEKSGSVQAFSGTGLSNCKDFPQRMASTWPRAPRAGVQGNALAFRNLSIGKLEDCGYFAAAAFFAVSFLFSAQRRFMASAIRLRPSGLSLRLCGVAAFAFLLPLGRPGPLPAFASIPESSSRACCSFEISASISAIIRVTSTCCLLGATENCLLGRILPVSEF